MHQLSLNHKVKRLIIQTCLVFKQGPSWHDIPHSQYWYQFLSSKWSETTYFWCRVCTFGVPYEARFLFLYIYVGRCKICKAWNAKFQVLSLPLTLGKQYSCAEIFNSKLTIPYTYPAMISPGNRIMAFHIYTLHSLLNVSVLDLSWQRKWIFQERSRSDGFLAERHFYYLCALFC